MIHYKVLKETYNYGVNEEDEGLFLNKFEKKIEHFIKDDWFPIGGIAISSTNDWIELAQALLKGERDG